MGLGATLLEYARSANREPLFGLEWQKTAKRGTGRKQRDVGRSKVNGAETENGGKVAIYCKLALASFAVFFLLRPDAVF